MFDSAAVSSRCPDPRGAASLALVLTSLVVAGCHARPPVAPPSTQAPTPVASSGFRAFRDPVTGAFVKPPPPGPPAGGGPQPAAPAAAAPAFVETAAPGGGTMIHLHGAFKSDVEARVGARGAEVTCATAAAPR